MFTASGKIVAASAVAALIAGAVLRYPEVIAIGVACLAALLMATLWIAIKPNVVAVREIAPSRVTEGEPAQARLTLTNRGSHWCPPFLADEVVGRRTVAVALPSLAPGQTHTAIYELPTDRRGVYDVGPLTIGQTDPFRLLRAGRSFSSTSRLWVYPRVHRITALPNGTARDIEGPTSSSAPQGGVAFHAIREMVWGDDFRLVHWLSTARTGTLHVRQMVVPDEPRILVVLDTSTEPYDDTSFEDAVRVAASLAAAASMHGYPLTMRTTGGASAVADQRGDGHIEVLDLLAAARRDPADPGLAALTGMIPDETGVSLTVVTGQPSMQQLAVVGLVRPDFQMAALAQLGEQFGRRAAPPPGVFGVNVRTSEEFALVWSERAAR
jgi:uncharacterized protein (DUF58 family)